MNVAYFPFTSVDGNLAAAAHERFGRFSVYTPVRGHAPKLLHDLSEAGKISLRAPVSGDEELVMRLCRSFRNFGEVHQGRAAGLKQFAESGFYNDQFAVEIRSEILKAGGDAAAQASDMTLNSRVFLQLAQDFDLQETEIDMRLATADMATKRLFDELKGEGLSEDDPDHSPGAAEDTGAFMTESRMTAWCQLAGWDEDPPEAFLTDSSAVLELLTDRFPTLLQIGSSVPGTGTDEGPIAERIERLSRMAAADPEAMRAEFAFSDQAGDDGFRADIFVLPDIAPDAFVQAFTGLPSKFESAAKDVRHSFICLISPIRQKS